MGRVDPYVWHCATSDPSLAFHPNGSLYAAMRQTRAGRASRRVSTSGSGARTAAGREAGPWCRQIHCTAGAPAASETAPTMVARRMKTRTSGLTTAGGGSTC